mmetsp:Transcript_10707/g.25533  ORF Transcript_10707/g.25533 Transcript_10707/m.25533 type:complete len:240 (+) Transcript_10707:1118-1837(+)
MGVRFRYHHPPRPCVLPGTVWLLLLRDREEGVCARVQVVLVHKLSQLWEGIVQPVVFLGVLRARLHDAHLRQHIPPRADHAIRLSHEERDVLPPQNRSKLQKQRLCEVGCNHSREATEEIWVLLDLGGRILVHEVSLHLVVELQKQPRHFAASWLADAGLCDEEVVAQISLCHTRVVHDCERSHARKNQVFQHFGCKNRRSQHTYMPLLESKLPALTPQANASVFPLRVGDLSAGTRGS